MRPWRRTQPVPLTVTVFPPAVAPSGVDHGDGRDSRGVVGMGIGQGGRDRRRWWYAVTATVPVPAGAFTVRLAQLTTETRYPG